MSGKREETYYEILKVDPKASVAEIVAAYHAAKNAFSKDSVATYSLFSAEEAREELDKLEKAYLHLSNIDRKRAYDQSLHQAPANTIAPEASPEIRTSRVSTIVPAAEKAESFATDPVISPELSVSLPGAITGPQLKQIREKRLLSVDDVSRITKIPSKFILAIENENTKQLPARVYIQGFLRNLAALYRLDPKDTAKSYLENLDIRTQESQAAK